MNQLAPAPRVGPPSLVDSARLRLATVFVFYFCQGVPSSFFNVVIPAYMAQAGADTAAIASVVGASALPWTLKLVNGFIMDRYTWLPMGRRRVWLLGAQALLAGGMLVGAVVAPSAKDVMVLATLAFLLNLATTFQDVAVDSIVVDVMPEEEQPKASGIMFGAQQFGAATIIGLGGVLISRFGIGAAFLFCAVVSGVGLCFGAMVRERHGEKQLPWTEGVAHPRNVGLKIDAWLPLLKEGLRALLLPGSLVLVPVLLLRAVPQGASNVLVPYLASHRTGWSTTEYTNLNSSAGFGSAVFSLVVGGWLVAKVGLLRSLRGLLALTAVFFGAIALLDPLWSQGRFVIAYMWGYDLLGILLAVTILPIAMQACSPRVAATQFSIFAALSNFGRPVGAWLAAGKTEHDGPWVFSVVALTFLVATVGSGFITLSKPSREVEQATLPLAGGAPGEN